MKTTYTYTIERTPKSDVSVMAFSLTVQPSIVYSKMSVVIDKSTKRLKVQLKIVRLLFNCESSSWFRCAYYSKSMVLYRVDTIMQPKAKAALFAAEFIIEREFGNGFSLG